MTRALDRPQVSARDRKPGRRKKEPGGVRLFLRGVWSLVWAPIERTRHRYRRLRRSGVDKTRRWRSSPWMLVIKVFTWVLAVVFILWLVRSAIGVGRGHPLAWPAGFNPDARCAGATEIGVSCGALTGFLTSLLSIALASAVFLLLRLSSAVRRYRRKARKHARELMPTAGSLIGDIVGRDELCRVVMADLHDRKTRRPHVLIGGVGTGKTAVLVRLTELLARRRAVPVPIRLRDAKELDFAELAKARFIAEINRGLASTAEGEKIWRRLLQDGRIVVLADGLEEAFAGDQGGHPDIERDNRIRLAIRRAHEQGLPLVIASRPHDPLREMDANISDLEPLSEEAALAYVAGDTSGADERWLDRIVETAEVAEAPLYLQITRELYRAGRLERLSVDGAVLLDTRSTDRSTLRLALLSTWERALVRGDLYPHVALNRTDRQTAIEWMSILACIGLKNDSLDVKFDRIHGKPDPARDKDKALLDELRRKVEKQHGVRGMSDIDVRLAATYAARLGLVEVRDDGVRFHHSLMQAYLGHRLMGIALTMEAYLDEALPVESKQSELDSPQWRLRPGRELLIALVLFSRRRRRPNQAAQATPAVHPRSGIRGWRRLTGGDKLSPGALCGRLCEAARWRTDVKALDIFAAALEIGSVADAWPADIAPLIRERWKEFRVADDRTLEEAKTGLVHRFGAALRTYGRRHAGAPGGEDGAVGTAGAPDPGSYERAYAELYAIACREASYPIQLAIAQELGAGGAAAYRALEPVLVEPAGCGECRRERTARRGEGVPAGTTLEPGPQLVAELDHPDARKRAPLMSAWLAPLLVGSVGLSRDRGRRMILQQWVEHDLDLWLRHVGRDRRRPLETDLPLAEEIALAQGFKYAANRRRRNPNARSETRTHLYEHGQDMLKRARYWFSQLTLIQAWCLWELPDWSDTPDGSDHPDRTDGSYRYDGSDGHRGRVRRDGGPGNPLNPRRIERRWRTEAGSLVSHAAQGGGPSQHQIHPFVEEAADLAARALEIGHPERFIWIDECGVVSRVGSRRLSPGADRRRHRLWIPPSTGWSALDPRAQQLVADVMLLWNLAARGHQPSDIERRLDRANRVDLPLCLTQERWRLAPQQTVGMADRSVPGLNCAGDCKFDLCPYPSIGEQRERVELSEAFCRRQRTLLLLRQRPFRRRTASWQGILARRLQRFWSDMADRARGPQPITDRRTPRR
jgi:hypothetical protein